MDRRGFLAGLSALAPAAAVAAPRVMDVDRAGRVRILAEFSEKVVALQVHQGRVYVATEHRVYELGERARGSVFMVETDHPEAWVS